VPGNRTPRGGWATSAQALALVVAAVVFTAGCSVVPAASGGSPDDAGPELDPSVTLPLRVEGVASCTLVRQRPGAATPGSADASTALPARLANLELPCLTAGAAINPARLGGRPVVLNLWATWCLPCREEMPMLQQTQTREGAKVQFVGVDTKDRPDWAAEFLPQVKVTYPEVVDTDGQLLASVRSPGLPVTIVVDRDGRIVGRQVGRISQERLDDLIKQAGA